MSGHGYKICSGDPDGYHKMRGRPVKPGFCDGGISMHHVCILEGIQFKLGDWVFTGQSQFRGAILGVTQKMEVIECFNATFGGTVSEEINVQGTGVP